MKNQIDFIDISCSSGGTVEYAKNTFCAYSGLGIDINPEKVSATRENGHSAFRIDIEKSPSQELVEFTI